MAAPDENPVIASALDEAAHLTTAANAKLAGTLAIAERNAAFNADRQWFKSRPDRSYRARLATQQEVADLHASGRLAGSLDARPVMLHLGSSQGQPHAAHPDCYERPDLQSERLIH
jgi:hypothetical protein